MAHGPHLLGAHHRRGIHRHPRSKSTTDGGWVHDRLDHRWGLGHGDRFARQGGYGDEERRRGVYVGARGGLPLSGPGGSD